ncbi:hypothetical protein [Seonamhaeicola sp.]|uniref:hypothetical protein n=1 Tax=Seonamhaeicola sp. TaxID=1912245 RepID=UPI002622C666|nr:hypothetical protein [Seonamhaeicola sp.]
MKSLYIVCIMLCCTLSFSQTKNEKEERIKPSEFPEVARSHFNNISGKVKYLKFFKETDGDKQSFEAKFKYKRQHYSVEFDSLGKLEDIEIVIKEKDIPRATLENIEKYYDEHFKKVRLIKIQKQFVNITKRTDKQFINFILRKPNNKHTHFEIIAEIKTKKRRELRELTFDRHGNFEKSRLVTSSSYEHALY